MVLIFANLFAPLSVGVRRNNTPQIEIQKAQADTSGIQLESFLSKTDTSVSPTVTVIWHLVGNSAISALLQKSSGVGEIKKLDIPVITDSIATSTYQSAHPNDPLERTVQKGSVTFDGLDADTDYTVKIVASQSIGFWGHPVSYIWNVATGGGNSDATSMVFTVKTNAQGNTTATTTEIKKSLSPDEIMPVCGIVPGNEGTIYGCFAQILYYGLFIPTSYIFALTGQFFDWAFGYSVSNKAYESPFVIQGWGLVRDFCNIFFIFVLLYVAFGTILSIHGFKTKETIINVVIIGLLINFSLFAAQLIIDSSNILARVFYNSNAIKITTSGANCTTSGGQGCLDVGQSVAVGDNGEIPLSAALVNKVNPQNLIINGSKSVKLTDTVSGQQGTAGNTSSNVGVGAFILITLLAIGVNVVGIIVFLSSGLVFIARVIGLWLAMIFVPLAFFSYAAPGMKDFKMVGWKHWWPETLKLAFLAPIFIFFIYLILQFLDTGLGLIDASSKTGTAFVIATIVPFIFIMLLLWQAKNIAKELSGTIGQTITGGVAAVGGLALGGAALGGAMLGRNIIGRGMSAASKTQDSIHYGNEKAAFNKKVEQWKNSGRQGQKPTWQDHIRTNNADPNKTKIKTDIRTILGGNLNAKQKTINEVDHARHEVDSIKEKAGLKGVEDWQLSGVDKEKLETTYMKEKRSVVESDIRAGRATDAHGTPIDGEEKYKADNRSRFTTAALLTPANRTANGELTDEAKKKVENLLSQEFNVYLKAKADVKLKEDYKHLTDESKQKVSGIDRVYAQSNKGSYDARNLSQTKVDKKEGIFTKASAALIAGIAMGVRTGLKNSSINHGSGQNDFLKDIGHTITEALKSAKVTVKVEESHGKSSDDHGHGGGGGHH